MDTFRRATEGPLATIPRVEGIEGHAALARAMMAPSVPTPHGSPVWTHTTVAGLLAGVEPTGA